VCDDARVVVILGARGAAKLLELKGVQSRLAMLMVMYFFDKSCFLEQQLVLIKARSVGSVPAPDDAARLVADSS